MPSSDPEPIGPPQLAASSAATRIGPRARAEYVDAGGRPSPAMIGSRFHGSCRQVVLGESFQPADVPLKYRNQLGNFGMPIDFIEEFFRPKCELQALLPARLPLHREWNSYRSNFSSARLYVRHLIHFGFGGKSHSSGSRRPIEHSRDLIFACPRWARLSRSKN